MSKRKNSRALFSAALVGALFASFGLAHAQTQDDGYVYLQCDGRETSLFDSSFLQSEVEVFRIGNGQWSSLSDQVWHDKCFPSSDRVTNTCVLSEDILRRSWRGAVETRDESINRVTGGWEVFYTGSGGVYTTKGSCRPIPPPTLPTRKF